MPRRLQLKEGYLLAATLLLLPIMISNTSLWIDEGASAIHALQPTFSDWWQYLNKDTGGDAQQPLGMFSLWLTGHLVGTSEWQLRSMNLLWGGLALWFVFRAGQNIDVRWLPLLLVIQPFFWLYMNEARPYALQHACGAALLWAFTIFWRDQGRGLGWCILFTATAVILCYVTALAPIFLISLALVAALVAWRSDWKLEPKAWLIFILGLVSLTPVALYYVGTIRRGVTSAFLWNVDARYLAYVVFELGGASGLGPPGDQLRQLGRNLAELSNDKDILLRLFVAGFLLLCVGMLFLFFGMAKKAGERRPLAITLVGPLLLQIAIFFGLGLAMRKNFWPRHLNVAFPFYVAALGVAIQWSFRAGSFLPKALSIVLVSLLICSSFRLRYSPTYAKDDYRWASATARQASRSGHIVWWVANKLAANYYGLKIIQSTPGEDEAFSPRESGWTNVSLSDLAGLPLPDDIFISRPDVHDAGGIAKIVIQQNGYHLQDNHSSFEWWKR